MAKRSTVRARERAEKKLRKERQATNPGGNSRYARKVAWCFAHQVVATAVPSPKPWA